MVLLSKSNDLHENVRFFGCLFFVFWFFCCGVLFCVLGLLGLLGVFVFFMFFCFFVFWVFLVCSVCLFFCCFWFFGFLGSPASALEPRAGGIRIETGDHKNPKNKRNKQIKTQKNKKSITNVLFCLVNPTICMKMYCFAL